MCVCFRTYKKRDFAKRFQNIVFYKYTFYCITHVFLHLLISGIAAKATSTNVTFIASRCDVLFNSTILQYRNFGTLSLAVQKWAAINPIQHKTLLK